MGPFKAQEPATTKISLPMRVPDYNRRSPRQTLDIIDDLPSETLEDEDEEEFEAAKAPILIQHSDSVERIKKDNGQKFTKAQLDHMREQFSIQRGNTAAATRKQERNFSQRLSIQNVLDEAGEDADANQIEPVRGTTQK